MTTEDVNPQFPDLKIEITNILGEGKCSRGFKIGDSFQYPDDRPKMCPAALSVLRPYIFVLNYDGKNVYEPNTPNTFSLSCPDPIHPVVYKISKVD